VIDFVNGYRKRDDIEMVWFCVPLRGQKFVLGQSVEYLQWDPSRNWIRDKPTWSHKVPGDANLPPEQQTVFDQYTMDDYTAQMYPGFVALVNGIRAEESLMRYRASVNKLNDNYINVSSSKKANLCKPIYDWLETDVFKYLYDHEIPYCVQYDRHLWARMNLRVSTPLHAEYAKRIGKLRAIDPEFYEGLIDLFPEMILQDRYYAEMDRGAVIRKYGKTYFGVRRYIMEHVGEKQRAQALEHFHLAVGLARKSPESYNPEMLLKWAMAGSFKRLPLPDSKVVQQRKRARASE
jgi:predicted phosphoadenosine phosphosulfate sulfurtransferase